MKRNVTMKRKIKKKMGRKRNKSVFEGIMEGLHEAAAIARGEAEPTRVYVPERVDVKAIRQRLNLTQAEFAARFSFNIARVRDWEQGRSHPDGALRAYLLVIDRETEAVEKALVAA
jgi:putative transcriptional regulator